MVVCDSGYLAGVSKNIDIVRFDKIIHFYCGVIPHRKMWFGTRNPVRNDDFFFDKLHVLGFETRNYRLGQRIVTCSSCGEASEKQIQKGVDVGLSVFVMQELYRDSFDRLFLIAGDGDFSDLLSAVKKNGKTVVVLGEGATVSESLRTRADRTIMMDDLIGLCRKGPLQGDELRAWEQIVKAIPQPKPSRNRGGL